MLQDGVETQALASFALEESLLGSGALASCLTRMHVPGRHLCSHADTLQRGPAERAALTTWQAATEVPSLLAEYFSPVSAALRTGFMAF